MFSRVGAMKPSAKEQQETNEREEEDLEGDAKTTAEPEIARIVYYERATLLF